LIFCKISSNLITRLSAKAKLVLHPRSHAPAWERIAAQSGRISLGSHAGAWDPELNLSFPDKQLIHYHQITKQTFNNRHMIRIDTEIIPPEKGVYLVGGSLRDTLLGRKPLDYDIVVQGTPLNYARKLEKKHHARLVSMGKPGQEIIRVVLRETVLDISIVKGGRIEEDLKQRDFTINALACDTMSGQIIDIAGGLDDLKARCLRMVSPTIFTKDPLRLLRAYRLSASLGFTLDAATIDCIQKDARRIRAAAGERIRYELFKILENPSSCVFIRQMKDTGLLFELFPELAALKNCGQTIHHDFDGLTHTLRALSALENLLQNLNLIFPKHAEALETWLSRQYTPILKSALLWHDIGKPVCLARNAAGNVQFRGHEKAGAAMAVEITGRLKFSNQETRAVEFIIRNHLRPLSLFIAQHRRKLTSRGVARFFLKCEAHTLNILLHAAADMQAKKEKSGHSDTQDFIRFVELLIHRYYSRYLPIQSQKPLISGKDLIQILHLPPSPLFKTVLSRVEEARLSGHVTDKQEALRLAREIALNAKTTS